MITEWQVTNFKSIGKTLISDETEITEGKLDFRPLTLFCGVNSSGKSTLIQSILLIAQNKRTVEPRETISLNGSLIKLGSYGDIFSQVSDYETPIDVDPFTTWEEEIYNSKIKIFYSYDVKSDNRFDSVSHEIIFSPVNTDLYGKKYSFNPVILTYIWNFYKKKKEVFSCDEVMFRGKLNENEEYANTYKNFSAIINEINKSNYPKIIYVGPLRHDPKKPYPFISGDNNVGIDGEYTAAILLHQGKAEINYIPAVNFENPNIRISPKNKNLVKKALLNEAVNDWLKYLGAAESITSQIEKHGVYLSVNNNGNESGLDGVGVGVSQILPILTACLSAEEGSTLVFEQPELHLHPKLQTRLADFFLSVSLLNKQCILETHSEYLINRLRFRIASAPLNEPLNETIKIYFTSTLKNDVDGFKKGNTIFRPIEITPYAVMSDWPEDFFDEASKLADDIIRAASEKYHNPEGNTNA